MSSTPIRVLAVDDEPDLCNLTKIFLEIPGEMEVDTVFSVQEARDALSKKRYDAVVSDYQMPGENGIQFLKSLRSSNDKTPFILFTGRGREEVVIEALNSGADSYLQKGGEPESQYAELGHRIKLLVRRHQAEEAVKESERRLSDIINFLPDATFAIDTGGHVIAWNKAIEEMTGIPANDIIGKGDYEYSLPFYGQRRPILIDLVSIPGEELTKDIYSNIKKEGHVLIAETSLPCPLGKYSVLLGKASVLYDHEGAVIGAIESIRDITESRNMEDALRAEQEKYVKTFIAVPDAVLITEVDTGTILLVNDAAFRLFGYTREELIGDSTVNLGIWSDPEERADFITLLREQGRVQEYMEQWRRKSGEVFSAEISADTVMLGSKEILISVIHDITQRAKIEEALRESESHLSTLVQTIPDLIWLKDTDGIYLSCNATFERFFDALQADIVGRTDYDFLDRELADFFIERDRMAIEAGKSISNEEWVTFKNDGHRVLLETIKTPMHDGHGTIIGVLGIGRDITERKRTEEALRQTNDELQAVNQQLAAAEEELRKQLNTIILSEDEWREEMAFSESLIESLPDIFYLYDAQTLRLVRWNKNYQEVSGYAQEEMFAKYFLDWHRADKAEAVLAAIHDCIEKGQASIEAPLVMKDGREIPYLLTVRRLDTRERSFLMGVGVDITERLQFESRLRRLNRELVAIKECNQAMTKAHTEQELLDEVCRIVCDAAGYRMAWIGMAEHDKTRSVRPSAWGGHDHGYVSQVNATWGEDERGLGPTGMCIKTKKTIFIQDFFNDARTGPWRESARMNGYRSSIALPLMDAGEAFGALMIYSDQINGFTTDEVKLLEEMTDDLAFGILSIRAKESQVKAEQTLRKGKERYSKLLATIPDLVIMTDINGSIVLVNEPTLIQSGYTSDEVIGHSLVSFMAPEDADKAIENIKRRIEGKLGLVEYHLIMKDGRRILFEVNGDVLRDPQGEPTGFVFVGRDVTEPRQMGLRLTDANKKLRVMTSITRHDIRNMLMALKGNLALMENERPNLSSDEHLRKVYASAERISLMIEFTKAYEDIGVHDPTWQDIRTLVESSTREVNLGQIKVINEVPDGTEVFADPMLIKVLHNLIHNALKHGGKVTTIRFYLQERDGVIAIVIEDDGVGISSNMKGNLFTEGFGKDHGLGLFLCREILAITGIRITEEGNSGKGAKFVMIPPKGGIRAE
jgi:PAS domain S-box-containing protein